MNQSASYLCGFAYLFLVCSAPDNGAWATAAETSRPNVLVIVADDLGYKDVGFQGSKEIPTPALDQLASTGLRCTNGYVSHPFCSPTRAGLLTGRYQHRFGHENNPVWKPESTIDGMPLNQITLPQQLKSAGYFTGAVGKWHLGAHPQFHPMKRGFDEYFGILGGGHQYFPGDPGGVEYTIPLNRNGKDESQTKYLTEQFGDEAVEFIKRRATTNQPWMLYLAFNAPHTPLQAPESWLQKFAHISEPNRQKYAAMIGAMDHSIGRVLSQLDQIKQRENTLIFFFSDNGGPNLIARNLGNFTDNAPLRGAKGQLYEGGIRVPFLISWPSRIAAGTWTEPVISLDVLPTVLAAGQAPLPPDRVLDGVNLLPYLTGQRKDPPHDRLFWRSQGPSGNHAMREGKWKLVKLGDKESELYDLSNDVSESNNIASSHSTVVAQMERAMGAWEKEMIAPVFESPAASPPPKPN